MKILMVSSLFPNNIYPNQGTFSLERLRGLLKFAQLKVVAPVPYFPSWNVFKCFKSWYSFSRIKGIDVVEGVDVYHPKRFVIPKIGGVTSGIFYRSALKRSLNRIYKEFSFDVIDAHFVWPDGYAAMKFGQDTNIPVCITAHGSDLNLMPNFPWIKPFIQKTISKADRVVTVSQALSDIAQNLGAMPEKIRVIHNGVDQTKFKQMDRLEARTGLGIDRDAKVIISVGSLIPIKGQAVLIDAMEILINREGLKNLRLIIVGEGEMKEVLNKKIIEKNIQSHVRLVGPVAHKDLYRWLSASDYFCLTSSREGWPTVFFEAWACGLPVLATAVGGTPEAICSDRYGLLIEKQNPVMVAEALKKAMSMEWNSEELIAYAADNTWDKMVGKMYSELEIIVEEHKKRTSDKISKII